MKRVLQAFLERYTDEVRYPSRFEAMQQEDLFRSRFLRRRTSTIVFMNINCLNFLDLASEVCAQLWMGPMSELRVHLWIWPLPTIARISSMQFAFMPFATSSLSFRASMRRY